MKDKKIIDNWLDNGHIILPVPRPPLSLTQFPQVVWCNDIRLINY